MFDNRCQRQEDLGSSSRPRSCLYLGHLASRHLICGSNLFIFPIHVFYWAFCRSTTTAQLRARHDGQTDKKGLFAVDPETGRLWLIARPRHWRWWLSLGRKVILPGGKQGRLTDCFFKRGGNISQQSSIHHELQSLSLLLKIYWWIRTEGRKDRWSGWGWRGGLVE